jgi:hypothetical protein
MEMVDGVRGRYELRAYWELRHATKGQEMKDISKRQKPLSEASVRRTSSNCQRQMGVTVFLCAIFSWLTPGLADSPASSPDDPNFAPTNVVVKVAVGPNEYSRLEDALYQMGSQKMGRDAEEVCKALKNVCTQETTVWEIDYSPGLQVLSKNRVRRLPPCFLSITVSSGTSFMSQAPGWK